MKRFFPLPVLFLLTVLFSFTFVYYYPLIRELSLFQSANRKQLEKLLQLKPIKMAVVKPLHVAVDAAKVVLLNGIDTSVHSVEGIFRETNKIRLGHKLPPLNLSTELTAAATERARHMFAEQYFDHKTPAGQDFSLSIEMTGYKALLSGENIALGNFTSDKRLVQAWYESPGHRKNLLFPSFTEIGLATVHGNYKGHDTWISVQLFAVSPGTCNAPSASLERDIEKAKELHQQRVQQLEELREIIRTSSLEEEELRKNYGTFDDLYKNYTQGINTLNEQVSLYNNQIRHYNQCSKKIAQEYKKE